jgi:hypothetical protein
MDDNFNYLPSPIPQKRKKEKKRRKKKEKKQKKNPSNRENAEQNQRKLVTLPNTNLKTAC